MKKMIGILIVLFFLLSVGAASAKNYPTHVTDHYNTHESNGAYHENYQHQFNTQSEIDHQNGASRFNIVENNGGTHYSTSGHYVEHT